MQPKTSWNKAMYNVKLFTFAYQSIFQINTISSYHVTTHGGWFRVSLEDCIIQTNMFLMRMILERQTNDAFVNRNLFSNFLPNLFDGSNHYISIFRNSILLTELTASSLKILKQAESFYAWQWRIEHKPREPGPRLNLCVY